MPDSDPAPAEPPSQGGGASTATDQTAADGGGPTEHARNRRPPRSNEFWLAVAGIAATVVVGVTSSVLAYRTSGHQIRAETDRAAGQFTRDQRVAAYLDFLKTGDDLTENEFEFVHQMDRAAGIDVDGMVTKSGAYHDQVDKYREASVKVQLVGTADVDNVRGRMVDAHNAIMNQIQPLGLDVVKAGDTRAYAGKVKEALDAVAKVQQDDSGLRQQFIAAAKKDLGLVG
ncbi:hypothetical protein [Mycobacterium sp. OTB74]|uniref:hypothetical protein n=1 Tax=Mycobacterium sp. OTB74 TaxID=1853452 RepID=UPI002475B90C|nr:hypothetical protein [Mycobacterium sp. OTB74]MDH6242549.1 hypothetical protein [Mycobacterium sp. OTB74]